MMQGSHGDNDEGGMQPMETDTSYGDDGENDGVFRDGFSRRSSCHPCNKFILCGGVIFIALALAAGISVRNNDPADSNSNTGNSNNVRTPSPAPVVAPSYFDQPIYNPPVNPPALPPQPTAPQSFQQIGTYLYPPPRDSTLPDHVNPATAFGHAISTNLDGTEFVVAMKNDVANDPANYFGAFLLYRFNAITASWDLTATLYDPLPPPATATHDQSVSLSLGGQKLAFSQGEAISVWLTAGVPGNNLTFGPLGNSIEQLGPKNTTDTWYVVNLAVSPSPGIYLGAIVSPRNGDAATSTSYLEIFYDAELHDKQAHQIVDTWERVARLPLNGLAVSGTVSFSHDETRVAVGIVTANGQEAVLTYGLETADKESWDILDDPMEVAAQFVPSVGGGIVSHGSDSGGLAIGSYNGHKNTVVLLLWNPATETWVPFGSNNVLQGEHPNSNFGATVKLDKEGTRLFVGAPGTPGDSDAQFGKIFIYEYREIEDDWVPLTAPIVGTEADDQLGSVLAVNGYGSEVLAGLPNREDSESTDGTGAVAIYRYMS